MTLNFSRGLSNWTQGSATATNGSRTVTFSGANLIAADPSNSSVNIYVAGEGDKFIVDGVGVATIASVDSASQITLDAPWSFATQTAVAYKIRRYNEVKTGEVAKFIQAAATFGQDSNPAVSQTIDDSVARGKLRESGGNIEIAVGATGAADGALKAGVRIDPASGSVSFPNGAVHNNPGFRNRIINGNFDIWQRGVLFTFANGVGAYSADRWIVNNSLGVSATVSKAAAPSGFLGSQALRVQATGVPVGGYIDVQQRFEGRTLEDLDGKNCVLSFDLNATTSGGTIYGNTYLFINTTLDNGLFSTVRLGTSFSISPGSNRLVIAVPAAQTAGLKYGAAIDIRINQASASGNMDAYFGAAQFESDPSGAGKANDFEFRPLPLELAMCQRYFETSYNSEVVPGTAGVLGGPFCHTTEAATSYASLSIQFRVMKRGVPTMTVYSPGTGASGKIYNASDAVDVAATIDQVNQAGCIAYVSGVSVGAVKALRVSWAASSEL